jgi:branched-chain amino acid aminotransferase
VDNGTLVTPPTPTNLRGITRETVLELAEDLGIACVERRFSLFDLWTASEAFMCGTSAEIVPVASIDGRQIGTGAQGQVTARLAEAYDRLVRTTGTAIRAEAVA